MSARTIGERVKIKSKDVTGIIVFAGKTDFAPGTWYGVILDEAKGKNNGTVGRRQYFKCPSNCGIFVRERELVPVDVGPPFHQDGINLRCSTLPEMKLIVDSMNQKLEALKWEKMARTLEEENSALHGKLKTMKVKFLEQKTLTRKQKEVIELAQIQFAQHDQYMNCISKLKRKLKWTVNEEDLIKKEKSVCEEEITRLSHLTELVVMEKEICEENLEKKETELAEAKTKIQQLECELNIAKADLKISVAEGIPTVHCIRSLRNENEKLNEICSDLESKLKLVLKSSKDEFSNKDSAINKLEKVIEELKAENNAQRLEIAELQETIDAMGKAGDLIEQVAAKNANLEQEKEELEERILELQGLREVDIQLEETLQELESLSQQEVTSTTSRLCYTKNLLKGVLGAVEVQKTTITKFRSLVCELKQDKEALQLKLQEAEMKKDVTSFQINSPQSKSFRKAIEMENLRLEIEIADQILQYWSYFMPDSFFAHGGENQVICVIAILDRLFKKTNFLISETRMKFSKLTEISKCDLSDSDVVQSCVFGQELQYRIYELRILLRQLQIYIDDCKAWELLRIGPLYSDLSQKSTSLDGYIELLCNDKLDAQTDMGELKGLIAYISLVFSHIQEGIDKFVLVDDHVKLFETGCQLLCFDMELTRTLLFDKFSANQVVSPSEEIRREIEAAVNEMSPIKLQVAKGQVIYTSDTKSISLLEQVKETLDKYVCTTHVLRRNIMKPAPAEEKWEWPTLRESYAQWNEDLKSVPEVLLAFVKSLDITKFADLELIPINERTICRRAKELRSSQDVELATTRQMLEDSKLEVSFLKKIVKSKDNELSLTKVRADIATRDLTHAMTRIDAMEAEICKLISERDLTKSQMEKAIHVIEEDWKCCLDGYRRENDELKARLFDNSLSKFPSLQVPKESDSSDKEYISKLYAKTVQLKEKALAMSLPSVVDLTQRNYMQAFHKQELARQKKVEKIKEDIDDLKAKVLHLKSTKFSH